MSKGHENAQDRWTGELAQHLRQIPTEYAQASSELKRAQEAFYEVFAGAVADRLNAVLEHLPSSTLVERQRVATWCNQELRRLKLAIRDPHTGHPAILVADLHDAVQDQSRCRFRLQVRDPSGRTRRFPAVDSGPLRLQLMEASPRREPFAKAHTKPPRTRG